VITVINDSQVADFRPTPSDIDCETELVECGNRVRSEGDSGAYRPKFACSLMEGYLDLIIEEANCRCESPDPSADDVNIHGCA
jgi:hypothetical protein